MVKTPDELFVVWLDGQLIPGETRRDFCEKLDIQLCDLYWAFCAGVSYSSFNRLTNDGKGD